MIWLKWGWRSSFSCALIRSTMMFSIPRLLALQVLQSVSEIELSVFAGKATCKAQEFEACSVGLSVGNLPICSERWYIKLQRADCFVWGNYASVWITAYKRALEILEDQSQGERAESPMALASRYTDCSTLFPALPGHSSMASNILHHSLCTTLMSPVVTTMPNGILFSLFILKEWPSRCCCSTTSLPSV